MTKLTKIAVKIVSPTRPIDNTRTTFHRKFVFEPGNDETALSSVIPVFTGVSSSGTDASVPFGCQCPVISTLGQETALRRCDYVASRLSFHCVA